MSFHTKTGAPIGPRTAPEFNSSSPSMTKTAVYQRERRLRLSSEQIEKERKSNRLTTAKRKASNHTAEAMDRHKLSASKGMAEKTIRHHLSKGRSVSDIAVREGWLVSMVQAAVDRIQGESKGGGM